MGENDTTYKDEGKQEMPAIVTVKSLRTGKNQRETYDRYCEIIVPVAY